MQYELKLIPHKVGQGVIHQRLSDGYVNATAMCKASGKLFGDYSRLKTTNEFINELSSDMGIPISELIQIVKGGEPHNQGTWVHPDIAINLAQWLSPKFAVQVSKWVREWMSGTKTAQTIPHHLQRYLVNRGKIPPTHFSMLNELTTNLIAPLEDAGYTLPDNLVPDISEGIIFCKWLRTNRNIEPKDFPTYSHEYPDGRVIHGVKMYPNEYLADFRKHFNDVWLPKHAPRYFAGRDKKALTHITKILLPNIAA